MSIKASQLQQGQKYFTYAGYRGSSLVTFLGVSDAEQKYGESGPVFKTLKEAMQKYNLKNAADIENQEGEYGKRLYSLLHDEKENFDYGLYMYKGRWNEGSSAHAVSFYTAEKDASTGQL